MDLVPESLAVIEKYLECGQDAVKAATELGLPLDEVNRLLNKRESREYIDRIYYESGFRNRHRMGELMDAIIAKKLEEMDDTGIGTTKDILDILALVHKMKMEEIAAEAKLRGAGTPNIQVNQQFNGYNSLLEKISNAGKSED